MQYIICNALWILRNSITCWGRRLFPSLWLQSCFVVLLCQLCWIQEHVSIVSFCFTFFCLVSMLELNGKLEVWQRDLTSMGKKNSLSDFFRKFGSEWAISVRRRAILNDIRVFLFIKLFIRVVLLLTNIIFLLSVQVMKCMFFSRQHAVL